VDNQILTKESKLKSWLIVLLMSLTIFTLTTVQLYNFNKTNATNKNLNQQIITTESPAEITSALLPINNNTITTNATTTLPVATAANTDSIPTAQSVYASQSITLPTSVKSFVWYIVDEAHENSVSEKHKKVSDHNPDYLPTNVVIPHGVSLVFLDADAPWDTPHPHTINISDNSSGNVVYSTGKLDYTNASKPTILPPGKYDITDTKFPWMKGTLTVTDNKNSDNNSNLIIGGFYTPTNQVANKLDNDGGSHPGWLGYYTNDFPKNGFSILSRFNFHYAACKYCPGGYWPDQKTSDHTLIIYSTSQPLSQALSKLSKMVQNNVYI
jgi:hypothetical protein